MNETDIKMLELLLGKLQLCLKHNICITTGHLQDGYHICIYGDANGEIIINESGHDLSTTINNCIVKITNEGIFFFNKHFTIQRNLK